jgi:hypothetical protein
VDSGVWQGYRRQLTLWYNHLRAYGRLVATEDTVIDACSAAEGTAETIEGFVFA